MLEKDPPPGVSCWPKSDDQIFELEAVIQGPENTPYEKGNFKLEISVPERYPFDPPKVRFATRIYHPNIDGAGRICLSTLVVGGEKGEWKPASNLSSVLLSIRLLLSAPNPDDGLVAEISSEYKNNYAQFVETAKEWTRKFAMSSDTPATSNANVANTTISNTDRKKEDGNKMMLDSDKSDNKSKTNLQKSPKSPPRKTIEIDSDSDNDFFGDDDDSNEEIKKEDKKSAKSNSGISPNKNSNDGDTKADKRQTQEKTPTKEENDEKNDSNLSPKAAEATQRKPGLSLFGKSNNRPAETKKLSLSLRKDK
jgi:ubiquitin-conjugating enzyme E2 T